MAFIKHNVKAIVAIGVGLALGTAYSVKPSLFGVDEPTNLSTLSASNSIDVKSTHFDFQHSDHSLKVSLNGNINPRKMPNGISLVTLKCPENGAYNQIARFSVPPTSKIRVGQVPDIIGRTHYLSATRDDLGTTVTLSTFCDGSDSTGVVVSLNG